MIGVIGNYAPIGGYILSAFALRKTTLFYAFFLFGFINDILNRLLKRWIRDPRPSLFQHEETGKFDKLTFIAGRWGMPSGHAQQIFYCIGYLLYSGNTTVNNINLIPILLLLSVLTVYQRWIYHYHTVLQLLVGSIVGFLFGIFSVHSTRYLLTLN